jgi:DNA-binding MarR family transcriptional regulator
MPPNDPVDRIMQSTFEMGRVFRQRMMGAEAASERGPGAANLLQMHALLIVEEHKGITMKQLADALHVASPSATSLVNRLVKLRWIQRLQDPANRKLVRLKLTETGRTFLRRKHQRRRELMRELLAFLSSDERESLARLQEKILERYARSSHS